MSKVFMGIIGMVILTVSLTGCAKTSTEGGRTGDDTFKISVPALTTVIQQGELQTVDLTLQ